MDLSLYNDSYDELCRLLPENASVMDAGCGPGNISRYLKDKRPDLKIFGIDFAPRMIELARKNIPDGLFEIRDIRKISELKQRFDAIICGFCIPYLSATELESLVIDSEQLLNENGILYLSWIKGAYGSSGLQCSSDGKYATQVFFYEHAYVSAICERSSLTQVLYFEKQYIKNKNHYETHVILVVER